MTIEGAKAFIEKLSEPVKEIENDIKELEQELDRLKSSLDTSENQFKMETVKKNNAIQNDIQLTQDVLNKAQQRRQELVNGKATETYKRTQSLINAHKKAMREQHVQENQEIIQAIDKVRELYTQMKEQDTAYRNELLQFVDDVAPYLDANDRPELGAYGNQESALTQSLYNQNPSTRLTVLETVNEKAFDISGLIVPTKETHAAAQERSKYNTI